MKLSLLVRIPEKCLESLTKTLVRKNTRIVLVGVFPPEAPYNTWLGTGRMNLRANQRKISISCDNFMADTESLAFQ